MVRKSGGHSFLHRRFSRIRLRWLCRERKVVLVILLPWMKRKKPLRVSEASLRAIRRAEQQRLLAEESDKRHARRKARFNLITKP
jgi:hypothetical protein